MQLSNGMELEIIKNWYNKTKVQEDGITHVVDPEKHTVYQFGMAKNYFDVEEKSEVVKQIINDLESTIRQLQQMLNKEEKER